MDELKSQLKTFVVNVKKSATDSEKPTLRSATKINETIKTHISINPDLVFKSESDKFNQTNTLYFPIQTFDQTLAPT